MKLDSTVEASVGFFPSSMYNPRRLPNRGFSFRIGVLGDALCFSGTHNGPHHAFELNCEEAEAEAILHALV